MRKPGEILRRIRTPLAAMREKLLNLAVEPVCGEILLGRDDLDEPRSSFGGLDDGVHILRRFPGTIDEGEYGSAIEGEFEHEALGRRQCGQAAQRLRPAGFVEGFIGHDKTLRSEI